MFGRGWGEEDIYLYFRGRFTRGFQGCGEVGGCGWCYERDREVSFGILALGVMAWGEEVLDEGVKVVEDIVCVRVGVVRFSLVRGSC